MLSSSASSAVLPEAWLTLPQLSETSNEINCLPGEIRNKIYAYALYHPGKISIAPGSTSAALLSVNRQIRSEVKHLFFLLNGFKIGNANNDNKLTTFVGEPTLSSLRSFVVNTPREYLAMISELQIDLHVGQFHQRKLDFVEVLDIVLKHLWRVEKLDVKLLTAGYYILGYKVRPWEDSRNRRRTIEFLWKMVELENVKRLSVDTDWKDFEPVLNVMLSKIPRRGRIIRLDV